MMTNKKYNADLANSHDRKILYDFAKEMYFEKAPGNKSTRDRSLIRLLKSPSLMVSASGVSSFLSKTRFMSSDRNELCDRLKLIRQEKQAFNNSHIINQEFIAIVDKLLEYKCISTKQLKFFLVKCLNQMKSMKLIGAF